MLLRKAYRYRIYPDAAQEKLFGRTIGCCRLVYNLCLEQKNEYLRRRKSLSKFDQIKELTALKEEFDFLYEMPHHPLQQAVYDVHAAFDNYFAGLKRRRELAMRGIKANPEDFPKWPTFHKRGRKESFRYPDPKQIKIEPERIFLPKAGWVRIAMHRPIAGKIKNVTVSAIAGEWFVSAQTDLESEIPVNRGPAAGIDLGSAQPIVLSDGTVFGIPRAAPTERRKLEDAHRTVHRRKKGSKNREKAKLRLARLQAKAARRRRDAAHKATTTIAKNHGVVVIEDLKVKQLTKRGRGTAEDPGTLVKKRANENRALLEIAPRTIRTMLEYKCRWYGSTLVVVDPAHTSETCSACGVVDPESRITRARYVCGACGGDFDPDVNAARNILIKGTSATGGLPGMACGSSQTIGRKQEEDAREGGSSALQGRE
ncbi:RNA-guided endonuclease InsQ/TnpB family protein [Bradyrhizobium vignae]|uniref:Transposase n=1 Tax=Bradyrhizobium vignae TaxID=1549949 RepID=A0A2U3PUR8_9BRAD|nr:RNA-guided endonuclease TnpB family protein [Bradyrhizobium vignae]SPP92869.1 transposase [Bradyrhizobium vignae]